MRLLRTARRRRQATSCSHPALAAWLSTPEPSWDTPLSELPLLAIDIETTGLNSRRDSMLAVGYVPIDGESIRVGGAASFLLRPETGGAVRRATEEGSRVLGQSAVGQSAVVHRLTDDELANGISHAEAIDRVAQALTGRILVAHYACLEVDFLRAACRAIYGIRPPITSVDTLTLQHRLVSRSFGTPPRSDELRLWASRQRFGLPPSRAHDALADAFACAELYLAQSRELAERGANRLADLDPT